MPTTRSKPYLHNLPGRLSTFVGREREIAEVKQRLSSHRLVTVTGPGGSGKTRLALQAAGELLAEFKDGIWLIEFAPLADGAFAPQAVALAVGVSEQPGRALIDTLVDHFLQLHSLLLFDNCEHLIGECAQLADALLKACPDLRILATSRETLDIPGEAVFVVPSLSLPEPQPWRSPASAQHALLTYEQSEAVRLFMERATLASSSSFELTAENGMWVADICRRLDGMPLAIELAAARVRTLSVQQIAQRLDDRFHLLTVGSRTAEPRQQTLAAALDWSYVLLSEPERRLLQRLSIFSAGGTLDAIQAICAGKGIELEEVLDVLSRLVEKSLVVADKFEGAEMRYHLLETIRQYAGEKLAESGDADEYKNRHLNYFVQWTEDAIPHLFQAEQFIWLVRIESEHDNIRAALEWSQVPTEEADTGLRLAAIMGYFWKLRGYHTEGRMRISAALAKKSFHQQTLARAQALYQAAGLAFFQSDYPKVQAFAEQALAISRELGPDGRLEVANALEILAEVATETGNYSAAPELYEEALSLYKEVGDLVGIGDTLKMMGWSSMRTGDYEKAETRLNEGLIVCRQSGDLRQINSALAGLGELAIRRGQYRKADDLLKESLSISQSSGEKWGIAIALASLGWVALLQHDYKEMRQLLNESLEVRVETGDRGGIAWCLEKLAEADINHSHFERSAILFGAASSLRATVGSVMDAVDQLDYENMISRLQSALGTETFAKAWAEGQALTLVQAIDYARAEPRGIDETSPKEKFGRLTEREREVAVLIAQGKSNREIANAMTVGVKTVETYVTRILNKLGFNSRVQIATWAMEKGLTKKETK